MKKLVTIITAIILFISCNKKTSVVYSEPQFKPVIQDDRVFPLPKDNGERYRPPKPPSSGQPVTGLYVTNTPNYSTHLTWDRYDKGYRYKIYRSQISGFVPSPETYIGISNDEQFDDGVWPYPQLQSATTYYYRVTHISRQGNESTPSSEFSVTTPTASTGDAVIFLDFDGHLETSLAWMNYNGGQPIQLDASLMSPNQKSMLVDSFRHRYAMWDVDIVTDEAAYQAANPNKRTRVVFTNSWEWYGRVGGIAFVGSFTWGQDASCIVFDGLLYYNTKYIQEAGFHEAGHTLGLYHHAEVGGNPCVVISSYTIGCCGEAPIMGVGYYEPVTKFKLGQRNCTLWQDDIQIISQILPLRQNSRSLIHESSHQVQLYHH